MRGGSSDDRNSHGFTALKDALFIINDIRELFYIPLLILPPLLLPFNVVTSLRKTTLYTLTLKWMVS